MTRQHHIRIQDHLIYNISSSPNIYSCMCRLYDYHDRLAPIYAVSITITKEPQEAKRNRTSVYSVGIVRVTDVSTIFRKATGFSMTLSALSPNAAARWRSRVVGVLTKPMPCTCWMRRRAYERRVPLGDSFIVVVVIMTLYAIFRL